MCNECFSCFKCGNGFIDKGDSNSHMEREHAQQYVFWLLNVEMCALTRVV